MDIKNSLQRFLSDRTEGNRKQLLSDMETCPLFIPIRWRDEQTFRVLHIQDTEENFYLPILTSLDEQLPPIHNQDSLRLEGVRLADCVQLIQSNQKVEGIVFNPMSDNVTIPSSVFCGQSDLKDRHISFGTPSKDYSWLTKPLVLFLQQETRVRHAYLLMVVRENQPIATIVVDGDEEDCLAIVSYLNQQQYSEIIDILPLQTDFSKEMIREIVPFYVKDSS